MLILITHKIVRPKFLWFYRCASGNSPLWTGRHQVSPRKKMERWFSFEKWFCIVSVTQKQKRNTFLPFPFQLVVFCICACDGYAATGPLEKLETLVRAMIVENPPRNGLATKGLLLIFFSKSSIIAFTKCNAMLSKVTFRMKRQHQQKREAVQTLHDHWSYSRLSPNIFQEMYLCWIYTANMCGMLSSWGCLCDLRAQGCGMDIFGVAHICIGCILPTNGVCCSFGGRLCALRAQGWRMYFFWDMYLYWIWCQQMGVCASGTNTFELDI